MTWKSVVYYVNRFSNGAIAVAVVGMLLTAFILNLAGKKFNVSQADVTPTFKVNAPEVVVPGETFMVGLDSNVPYDTVKWSSPELLDLQSTDATVAITIPSPTDLWQLTVIASVSVGPQTKQVRQSIAITSQ